ncbi:MAG: DUF3108 domain-containing protein [Muribaculaceae bacterium]|nr:DUF3108 domain-containing protein [Muribaculaceae bacterium]
MKHLLLHLLCIITAVCACTAAMAASPFANESISYKVKYKWGLINKHAGDVTITLHNKGHRCQSQLVAASQPWADKFFKLRDTLNGTFSASNLRPEFYEKIANEGNERKHDVVRFSYSGNTVTGKCTRKVWKKGKSTVDEARTLTAQGTTVDMLTSFYYMRTLPYASWKPGHKESLNIYSGKRKELLTITYHGEADVETEKEHFHCYHITFTFTSEGKKKTSDDMEAWISTDSRRIPVRLEGTLPVGKVHCLYTGK